MNIITLSIFLYNLILIYFNIFHPPSLIIHSISLTIPIIPIPFYLLIHSLSIISIFIPIILFTPIIPTTKSIKNIIYLIIYTSIPSNNQYLSFLFISIFNLFYIIFSLLSLILTEFY